MTNNKFVYFFRALNDYNKWAVAGADTFEHMKSKIIFALLFSTTLCQAQQWHFGPTAGLNYSGVSGKGMKENFTPGWQAGVFAELQLNDQLGIQPELLFSWNAYKKADDFMTYYNNSGRSSADNDIKLGYVSVPLLLKYHVNKTFSILVGPQYNHKVYEDENLLKSGKAAFKDYEVSANAGVQVNIGTVGLYGRYNWGLSNVNEVDDRYRWNSYHVQVGVALQIK